MSLNILHLSHEGLPDWRIEKSAISSLKLGNEVMFAGRKSPNYSRNTFSKIFEVSWNAAARVGLPFYWHSVRKQIEQVIRKARPDIIHAHNIFSARMASEFDIPFVYDDHEFWSQHVKLLHEMEYDTVSVQNSASSSSSNNNNNNSRTTLLHSSKLIKRKFITKRASTIWPKWEKEIVSVHPTLTVSQAIADKLKEIGNSNNVFLLPNFPMLSEVKNLEKPIFHDSISSVYAGSDGHNLQKFPHRNIDGLSDIFDKNDIGKLIVIGWDQTPTKKVIYKGFLSREDMFRTMQKSSIGIIPWKKHWSHWFVSPNKAYEYAHAGLYVLCTSSIVSIPLIYKDNCSHFENYEHLVEEMKYMKENPEQVYNKRVRSFEFAKSNLIWDLYEKNLFESYKRA